MSNNKTDNEKKTTKQSFLITLIVGIIVVLVSLYIFFNTAVNPTPQKNYTKSHLPTSPSPQTPLDHLTKPPINTKKPTNPTPQTLSKSKISLIVCTVKPKFKHLVGSFAVPYLKEDDNYSIIASSTDWAAITLQITEKFLALNIDKKSKMITVDDKLWYPLLEISSCINIGN